MLVARMCGAAGAHSDQDLASCPTRFADEAEYHLNPIASIGGRDEASLFRTVPPLHQSDAHHAIVREWTPKVQISLPLTPARPTERSKLEDAIPQDEVMLPSYFVWCLRVRHRRCQLRRHSVLTCRWRPAALGQGFICLLLVPVHTQPWNFRDYRCLNVVRIQLHSASQRNHQRVPIIWHPKPDCVFNPWFATRAGSNFNRKYFSPAERVHMPWPSSAGPAPTHCRPPHRLAGVPALARKVFRALQGATVQLLLFVHAVAAMRCNSRTSSWSSISC